MNPVANVCAGVAHFATRRARWLASALLLASFAAAAYVAAAFEIRTDLDSLLSPDLAWRKAAVRIEGAFPGEKDDLIIVIDADNRDRADAAADALMTKLAPRTDLHLGASRLNGGEFFDRSGLLFLSVPELKETLASLIEAQPILGPLAADPSLRGLSVSIGSGVAALDTETARTQQVDRAITAVSRALEAAEKGGEARIDWRGLAIKDGGVRDNRQFIEVTPKLDHSKMLPAADLVGFVRKAAAELGAADGLRIRITGSAPIADDELLTLEETFGPIAAAMFLVMIIILRFATPSWRMVAAIMTTIVCGTVLSSAFGLAAFGRFNLISVAFLPLFIGLGIDFAIQFCVRVRGSLAEGQGVDQAIVSTGRSAGGALALAALATTLGFLAFLPTTYRGASELGLIAGFGMVLAFALSLTLLPALLTVMGGLKGARERGVAALSAVDAGARRGRWAIVALAVVAAGGAAATLPRLKINLDPMALRSPKVESVATYLELATSPDTTPNTLNAVAPNVEAAKLLAAKIAKLPDVAAAMTIADLVPVDQDEKLALIEDARMLLDLSLNPLSREPPLSDAEIVDQLQRTAAALEAAGKARPDLKAAQAAAARLKTLAAAAPERRQAVHATIFRGFEGLLNDLNQLLSAQAVGPGDVSKEFRDSFVAADGTARIEIFPKRQLHTPKDTAAFVAAVRKAAPDVAGNAVTIVESGRTIISSFIQAGTLSAAAIFLLLALVFRSLYWPVMAMAPVALSGLLTFATCAAMGVEINLENMIALPLLFGVGVAFTIYFVVAKKSGEMALLSSSVARAVAFSALTTGASFAALALSAHPGTASMGIMLILALGWILATTLFFLPALISVTGGEERIPDAATRTQTGEAYAPLPPRRPPD